MPFHETYIAGVKFRPDAEAVLAAAPDDAEFQLDPEPTNPHDPNAVRVMLGDVHVGFVPRALSAEISAMIRDSRICQTTRRPGTKSGIAIHYVNQLEEPL